MRPPNRPALLALGWVWASPLLAAELPFPLIKVESYTQVCKLLNSTATAAPTANGGESGFNIAGADLGYSVGGKDRVWVFFGDTAGYSGYWASNGPDSVGYVDASPAS